MLPDDSFSILSHRLRPAGGCTDGPRLGVAGAECRAKFSVRSKTYFSGSDGALREGRVVIAPNELTSPGFRAAGVPQADSEVSLETLCEDDVAVRAIPQKVRLTL